MTRTTARFPLPLLILMLSAGALFVAKAQQTPPSRVLVSWTFPDAMKQKGPVDPDKTADNLKVSPLAVAGVTQIIAGSDNPFSGTKAFLFGGDNRLTPDPAPFNAGQYVSFSVQVADGQALNLDTLSFYTAIQDVTASGAVNVKCSTDGFSTSTDLGTTALTAKDIFKAGQLVTVNVSQLQKVSGTLEFRLYFKGALNAYNTIAVGNAADTTNPGISLTGTVVPAP